ncbi:phage tail tube protein [Pedobacter immunditicola]|uniref:phage tail tube protein n=1 Tax=Pedobacter immunditicola TaxID=3133440 RepID=UPI0030A2E28D
MADNFINGSDLVLFIGAEPIASSRSCSISMSVNMADATTKDNEGYSESIPTTRSWELSADGLAAWGGNIKELMTAFQNKTALQIKFSPRELATGDMVYSGTAYLESLEIDAPMEDGVSFSVSLKGSGKLLFEATV